VKQERAKLEEEIEELCRKFEHTRDKKWIKKSEKPIPGQSGTRTGANKEAPIRRPLTGT
jgi:hypothetical protein